MKQNLWNVFGWIKNGNCWYKIKHVHSVSSLNILGILWIWKTSGRDNCSEEFCEFGKLPEEITVLYVFFHLSPCNEAIEISNWNALWSYQDRGVINFKVFPSFLFLLFLRSSYVLDHLTPSFLGLYHTPASSH